MQEKASNVGFDWSEWTLAWEKLQEELEEFREELMKPQNEISPELKEEFGDLLFSIVNVGRLVGLHAEDSLRECNQKFKTRFQYIEAKLRERGSSLQESSLEEMDQLWNEAKIRPNQ